MAENNEICSYCTEKIITENYLDCNQCLKSFHIKCLKRSGTPGDLHGDVFFDFTCIRCSPLEELFVRKKLPWLIIIVLAIYNLTIQSQGLSHNGYFHWRSHISTFIDKNWKYLFSANIKQRKKWFGTLSGILSAYSPDFFESGASTNLTDSGWWKLSYKHTPKYFMKLYESIPKKQNKIQAKFETKKDESLREKSSFLEQPNKKIKSDSNEQSDTSEIESNEDYVCSRLLPYMGRKRKRYFSEQSRNSESSVKLSLMNFLAENISLDDSLLDNEIVSSQSYEDFSFNSHSEIPSLWSEDHLDVSNDIFQVEDHDFQPRIVQVTNFQNSEHEPKVSNQSDSVNFQDQSEHFSYSESNHSEECEENTVMECEKSLFTKKIQRPLPWLKKRIYMVPDVISENFENLSEYEEKKLFMALKKIFDLEKNLKTPKEIPVNIRMLYRQLSLRVMKRQNGLKPFDLNNFLEKHPPKDKIINILDRYSYYITDSIVHSSVNHKSTFLAQLSGTSDYELFESAFTSRVLMPFIYRNSGYFPNWLKLMCEIQYTKIEQSNFKIERSTIDFCYVRPYHIAGVNSLLQQMFWPGIDMSECLSYPDFSIVALYKKLIIGCAFMVPDVSYNEAYISYMAVRPHWQHSGIASFMLYHLTQTCMGKDITLHVSASNPAVCLYQKFGFKIEELVLDFYEKYLPIESNESRHAFFLRLKR